MEDASRPTYLPNLDGLRTLAALAVFATHVGYCVTFPSGDSLLLNGFKIAFLHNSRLGVRFFFVLSGFLITRIILHAETSPEGFSLKQFYLKRVLRIWPVYYMTVFIGFLGTLTGIAYLHMQNNNWPLLLAFAENFDLIALDGTERGALVSVLWSVSIEEQFYLVYPLLLLALPARWRSTGALAFFGLSLWYRWFCGVFSVRGLVHTLSAAGDLALGCLLAIELRQRPALQARVARLPGWVSWLPYGLVLATIALQHQFPRWGEMQLLLCSLQSAAFAAILLDQAFRAQSPLNLSRAPWLNRLGKYTYGFYCYHLACIFALRILCANYRDLNQLSFLEFGLFFVVAWLLAQTVSYLSYRFYELPFLRWNRPQTKKPES
jgi:peptidoglycan/LPS O-acetylase OafA/YrhL